MKDYKRLTKRNYFEGDYSVVPEELSKEITKWKEQHATEMTAPPVWYHLGERLCQLEDKIENGTLVELPCKVGDTVWKVERGYDYNNDTYFWHIVEKPFELGVLDYWWGRMIFQTKAEAEAKLAELKGERK